MKVTVSAPGKIHLLGEHVVVYGYPALLSSIDKRLYVTVETSLKGRLGHISIISPEDNKLVHSAVEIYKKKYPAVDFPSLKINISSQIPVGAGLGSSAALSAAIIGALMKAVNNIWNPVRINELSYEVEKLAHGNPSGADNTTVVFGELVWYRREFDFLKSIWTLPVLSYKIPKFAILNSGRPAESTKEMVNLVKGNYTKKRRLFENIFSDQEKQVKKILLGMKEGNINFLKQAIEKGERNLEKIGVVGERAIKIIKYIHKLGGVAKICGAGGVKEGSGIILCYHENLSKLKLVEDVYNVHLSNISLASEGIRIEH
ncbi:hypothetical protein COV53_06200 [Candidatus Gottesmanbacteria bacterium CG11_big_fil_rev_8_21_14_0_20_37_11]|uniref:mevalonate kinase n=3 Tax=Candidatus Gottesmaniibacteriota TaxID=1752720 RepID=A0A2M7RRD0_9BACT|nr:MAG: hypothetical protein AUJ73_04775 [Candidatus Gottesmanbacteria bacterium CG1_02_37_22]PIP32370.1 MAG: hypothetical protein COX23_05105 [Candidatus Gottesmanbacteria bacterium CG23_combo_of_CG06-09_8_20_14_all_37_19]PIR07838.1 MAG: hypothetical protein COV53_06200 [Candidatus Gottesmanbacteria bacterium CG11_big_fil_rev_8_21_14_0_20_37_11]PIZ02856.1 MAG: hypothetical protein COY59_02590 [Candidatus Gottesmanbacteria bacterium CG_4_10_14_0_8_um_filter_37_24]